MKKYASAQIEGMKDCAGHVFWSYRARKEFDGWCFRRLVDQNIIDLKELLR